MRLILLGLVAIVLGGCASSGGGGVPGVGDSLMAERIGVRAATDRLIRSADDTYEKAARVCDKARLAMNITEDLPVQDIAQRILASADLERMNPVERMVVVDLVIAIADEIDRRIESGELKSSTMVAVSWVARHVMEHSALYNPEACRADLL